jgi:hypothetical protein
MPTKKQPPKSMLSQLQSVGEGAIEKLANSTATRSAINSAINIKDRGEQIVTGIVAVEKRLLAVERRLTALENQGKGATAAGRATAGKAATSTAKPRTAKPSTAAAATAGTTTAKPATAAKPRSRAARPKS